VNVSPDAAAAKAAAAHTAAAAVAATEAAGPAGPAGTAAAAAAAGAAAAGAAEKLCGHCGIKLTLAAKDVCRCCKQYVHVNDDCPFNCPSNTQVGVTWAA
jgi:hypothetical protein